MSKSIPHYPATTDREVVDAIWAGKVRSKYTTDQLAAAADDIDAGMSPAKAAAAHGLTYSPTWQYWALRSALAAGTVYDLTDVTPARVAQLAAQLRAEDLSWGEIGVAMAMSESSARRAYETATNVQAAGTRTGQGGRYLADDERLYSGKSTDGDRRTVGPRLTLGEDIAAKAAMIEAAEGVELGALTVDSLRALADAVGVDVPSKVRKAELIELIESAS